MVPPPIAHNSSLISVCPPLNSPFPPFTKCLTYALATLSDHTMGGDEINLKPMHFFAKDFTKKTKKPLTAPG
ncbi:hypothetical protein JVT61DRAFT_15631 [Boletus reticuloceps]|uniref:Uncharacterized protein n=1 Tax=Boletus reticuloceps TaxID=495285 RepID=A0A8I3A3L1_9AGAM|nr:hypothetical protein JVT61DRAFT_15631 [Boletus reticuloceps]